ncbi:response regulator transcription factor, partial [bacterium]
MRILIADDHPLTLMGTKFFVESLGYTIEDICSNGITAFNLISTHQPTIAILDINMPGMDGLEILEKVYRNKMPTRVILLTMHKEMTIFKKANQWGIAGYILKENAQDELQKCLEEVKKGNQYISKNLENDLLVDTSSPSEHNQAVSKLTFTEKKILELIAQQKTSRQIADMLFISEKTVEGHR